MRYVFSLCLSLFWCLFATHLSQLFVRSKMNQSMREWEIKERTKRKTTFFEFFVGNVTNAHGSLFLWLVFIPQFLLIFSVTCFSFLLPLLLPLLLVVRCVNENTKEIDSISALTRTQILISSLFNLRIFFSPRSYRSTTITILLLFIVRKDEEIEVVSCSLKMENNIVVIFDIVDIVDGKLHSRIKWQ